MDSKNGGKKNGGTRDPTDINWLEHRILDHLAARGHAVSILDMRDGIAPGYSETTVNLIADMNYEGWIRIFDTAGGVRMAEITSTGRSVLFDAMTGHKRGCD